MAAFHEGNGSNSCNKQTALIVLGFMEGSILCVSSSLLAGSKVRCARYGLANSADNER